MQFKRSVLTIVMVVSCIIASAQQEGKPKLSFHTVAQAGMQVGAQGPARELQAAGMVQYNTWSGGVGAGINKYQYRTVPLFATVHKRVFKRLNSPFAFGCVGLNLPWVKKPYNNDWLTHDYKTGLLCEAGIGYQWPVTTKHALLLSAGYSVKRLRDWQQYRYIWGSPDMQVRTYKYTYQMNLVSVRAGFSF